MNDRTITRDHNIEILCNLGFQRVRNTVIFKRGGEYILSPAVSEGTNGKYWFDVREVNLNRLHDGSLLLVRIVPDLFIIEELSAISSLFTKHVMDNRPNSGNVYGIHISINKTSNKAFLFNIKNPDNKIATKLLSKDEVVANF